MELSHEETEESSRGGSWQVGWTGPQRGQTARQPRKWPEGRPGQKPQEESRSATQRAAAAAQGRATPRLGARRDTGLLTLATVRALRFLSGRDDQALPTVLKTWSRDGLSPPESLKSLEC